MVPWFYLLPCLGSSYLAYLFALMNPFHFNFLYQSDKLLLEYLYRWSHIHWSGLVSLWDSYIYCVLLLIFPSNSLHIMISVVSNANSLSKITYVMFLYQSSLCSWCSGTVPLWIHVHNAGFGSLWIHDFLALILFDFTYIMLVSLLFGFMTFYYWSSLNFLI